MTRRLIGYVLGAGLVATGVLLAGGELVAAEERAGVWVAVGLGLAVQVLLGVPLAFLRGPARMYAFVLGMLGRFGVVGLAALLLVPALELAPAATLLSLVAVFFATTLLEPVLFVGEPAAHREASE